MCLLLIAAENCGTFKMTDFSQQSDSVSLASPGGAFSFQTAARRTFITLPGPDRLVRLIGWPCEVAHRLQAGLGPIVLGSHPLRGGSYERSAPQTPSGFGPQSKYGIHCRCGGSNDARRHRLRLGHGIRCDRLARIAIGIRLAAGLSVIPADSGGAIVK